MSEQPIEQKHKAIYYRLVALWVICEAFAGGIMHGIKLPFTGMIISGLAVMCIVLIAWHVPQKGAIIKATIIVAIFKLLLSPQSPATAYVAVFFQGLMGELLFINKGFFKLSTILLSILSLVESAIQRILVLLIMGSRFWEAIDQTIQKILKQKKVGSYSYKIMAGYVLIHAIAGLLLGIYLAYLVKRSEKWKDMYPEYMINVQDAKVFEPRQTKKRKRVKLFFIIIFLVLLALLVQNYFDPSHSYIALNEITDLIIRFILILLAVYLFLAPVMMILIKKILVSQRLKKKKDMNRVMELLPQTKYIFISSWQLSAKKKGFGRLTLFLKILLINILSEERS